MRTSLLMALLWLCLISRAQNPTSIQPQFPGNNKIIQELQNGATPNSGVIPGQGISNFETEFPGQNTISVMASAILTDELKNGYVPTDFSTDQQVVIFPQGWSGVSSYINPDDPAIEALFAPLADKLVIIYNFNGVYYPSEVINTLGNWDPQVGYIAKFTQETNLEFKGQITQNRTLTLKAGWNLIPVLSACPVDVATFFQNSDVVVVKDVASWKLYWPGMGINNLYTLSPGKAYYVLMSSPAQITFTDCSTQDWECGDPLTDNRDGQVYPTVQIGAQCWMAKNLNFGSCINGNVTQTNNNIIEKYCYNNNESNCATYGGLYQWDEMMKYSENPGDQGLCPEGWYIPPDQEWTIMTDLYGGLSTAGAALKEIGTEHWFSPNTGATNASGFNGFPGGVRNLDGTFSNLSYVGNLWTSSLNDVSSAHRRSLSYNQSNVNTGSVDQNSGMSVRCRKRETLSVNPESLNLGFNIGTVTIEVTSGTSWSVQENIPWLTVEPMTGNQNGTLTVNYDINISGQARSGEINILADGGSPVVQISLTQVPYIWTCGDTIIDSRDGHIYHTVQIENQCWMDESLNFGVMLNEFDDQINNDITEKYCFENDGNNCNIYGGLYQWDEMMQYSNGVGLKGICPNGWHLPEFTEWDILNNFYGGYNESGGELKSAGTVEEGTGLWHVPNEGATNASGFNAHPAGYRMNSGGILDIGYYAMFWSSDYHSGLPMTLALTFDSNDGIPFESETAWGYSVRCLKNDESHTYIQTSPVSVDLPSPSGTTVLNIQSNADWTIEEIFNWLTVEPSSGNGNAQVTISFETNIIPEEREALILIQSGERSFEINLSQQGIIPELTVTPTHKYIPQQGGTLEFVVSSNTLWTVDNNETWFTVSPGNGSLNDTLILTCNSNDFPDSRMGQFTVTAAGGTPAYTITITQLGNAWTCGDSIVDFKDSKLYSTVQIGEQCWMGQNLNVGTRIDGANDQINNGTIEKYCYNNDEANCEVYGGLYQWNEMMQYTTAAVVQGICPTGWHLPTDTEWEILRNILGGESVAGGEMKEIGITHWQAPNTGATNSSGFTGLPAGLLHSNHSYINLHITTEIWSSTISNANGSWDMILAYNAINGGRGSCSHEFGLSVRCLKDETNTYQLEVTPSTQNVTAQSGTNTFNISSNTTWTITEDVTWLSVAPTSGSNIETLIVTYDANTESTARVGEITITVASGNPVVIVTVTQEGWSCGNSLTDTRDGKTYTTVQIGEQCWMGQNMNIGTRIDGSSNQTNNGTFEKYCYNNIETNCEVYGGLYQRDEMMQYFTIPGLQGICPTGWHVPTDVEWTTLSDFLGGESVAGGAMKETGTTHWAFNVGATNSSGFTGLPGGYRDNFNGSFDAKGYYGFWWSSTQYDTSNFYIRQLSNYIAEVSRSSSLKGHGISVRCLKDTPILSVNHSTLNLPYLSGSTTFEVTANTSWNVSVINDWLEVYPLSGNANATLTVNYQENTTTDLRYGHITIAAVSGSPVVTINLNQFGVPSPWSCGKKIFDDRDAQLYNTVQIGTQCWMAQNLNVGTLINSWVDPSNNATVEKYCYNNSEVQCDIYGGLYQWNEMMEYSTTQGIQGICPQAWHLPTEAEWTVLTNYVKSQPAWLCDGNSSKIGKALASTIGWYGSSITCSVGNNQANNNATGFTGLPGGYRSTGGSVDYQGILGYWWSSAIGYNPIYRSLLTNKVNFNLNYGIKSDGYSVRCLKDNPDIQLSIIPLNQNVANNSGSTSFEITSNTNWIVEESVSWLTVSQSIGSNNTTLNVSYDPNNTIESRVGEIVITAEGGWPVKVVTVTQAEAPPALSITPSTQNVSATYGATTFTVTSNTSWTITENVSWLTVSPMSGSNNSTLSVTYDENTSMSLRNGLITVSSTGVSPILDVNINVIQEGAAVALTVSPSNQNVTANAGTTTFTVTSNTSWTVAESSSWLSVSPNNGSYNGSFTATFDANAITTARNCEIAITASGGNPVVIVTVSQAAWSCGNSLKDTRDGKTYTTVQIGTQCWIAQNMNVGIRIVGGTSQTNNGTIEKYCYNNSDAQCDVYGGLYQWNEMMQYNYTIGVQGICPLGWHIPSDTEWTTLKNFVSSQPAYLCNNNTSYIAKALASTTNWNTSISTCAVGNNLAANNSTGFNGLPGGFRNTGGSLSNQSVNGYWWSSTQNDASNAWNRSLLYDGASVFHNLDSKSYGFSVRCLKD